MEFPKPSRRTVVASVVVVLAMAYLLASPTAKAPVKDQIIPTPSSTTPSVVEAPACPDVCAAVCAGRPEPTVPPNCPIPMCKCNAPAPAPVGTVSY